MLPWICFLTLCTTIAQFAGAEVLPVEQPVLDLLTRYAWFSSAAYSEQCNAPPFGAVVDKNFVNGPTDTQVALFRDNDEKEYILGFRGTSSVTDILIDLERSMVDCTAAVGAGCVECTVSILYCKTFWRMRGVTAR